jgi:hypothetical protein
MDNGLDIIGAFIDGERVDPVALKRALSEAGGRDYLVDLLALREIAGDIVPFASSAPPARPLGFLSGWATAAALLLCIGGGFILGERVNRTSAPAVTPVAARPARPGPAVRAPEPTRVIRLEPGVNWTETPGGK